MTQKNCEVRFGNILSVNSGIIMHGCNMRGVMGSGLALQIKNKWPECYTTYRNALEKGKPNNVPYQLGDVISYDVPNSDILVANCLTQTNFGNDKKQYCSYEAIYKAFDTVAAAAQASMIDDEGLVVHYPLIGAGLAGGDWSIISSIIDSVFTSKFPNVHRVLWIYE